MGRQIVKQPDGKYAIWSSVVDDFVIVDCADASEIIHEIVEDARRDITTAVHNVLVKLACWATRQDMARGKAR